MRRFFSSLRRLARRRLTPHASRLTGVLALLLTAYCSLLTFTGCSGGDEDRGIAPADQEL